MTKFFLIAPYPKLLGYNTKPMLLTPHTVAAIAIASLVKQPELALLLAFASHFVLDYIPHWDPPLLVKCLNAKVPIRAGKEVFLFIFCDFLIALTFGLFFIWRVMPNTVLAGTIFGAAFLANVPDGLALPLLFGKRWGWVRRWRRFHRIYHTTPLPLFWGLLPQAVVIAIGLLIALRQTLP